jgi:hypothetical protein
MAERFKCGPKNGLIENLRPERLRVSPKFHAILGCLLGQDWTKPKLAGLTITTDGHVLGMVDGDIGFNEYLGVWGDLDRNLRGVCLCVGASQPETAYLLAQVERFRS